MLCAAAEKGAPRPKRNRPRGGNPIGEAIALHARGIKPAIDATAPGQKADPILELMGAFSINAGHVEIRNALGGFSAKFIRQYNGDRAISIN